MMPKMQIMIVEKYRRKPHEKSTHRVIGQKVIGFRMIEKYLN